MDNIPKLSTNIPALIFDEDSVDSTSVESSIPTPKTPLDVDIELSASKIQALIRGVLSRKNEAKVETSILKKDEFGSVLAKKTRYQGRLSHVTSEEKDKNNYSVFYVASINKHRAEIDVLSNGQDTMIPADNLSGFKPREGNVSVIINGGFFEIQKEGALHGVGKMYGFPAGTPIGPHKTSSLVPTEPGFDSVKGLLDDDPETRESLAGTVTLSKGTKTPVAYKEHYGIVSVDSTGMKMESYEDVVASEEAKLSVLSAKAVFSAAPILSHGGRAVISEEMQMDPKFQFPKNGICPPGYLLHGSSPNPRSAIGVNDREIKLLYVVGRGALPKVNGLTIAEMSRLTTKIDMTDSINLDGGGSSFMAVMGPEDKEAVHKQMNRESSTFIKVEV